MLNSGSMIDIKDWIFEEKKRTRQSLSFLVEDDQFLEVFENTQAEMRRLVEETQATTEYVPELLDDSYKRKVQQAIQLEKANKKSSQKKKPVPAATSFSGEDGFEVIQKPPKSNPFMATPPKDRSFNESRKVETLQIAGNEIQNGRISFNALFVAGRENENENRETGNFNVFKQNKRDDSASKVRNEVEKIADKYDKSRKDRSIRKESERSSGENTPRVLKQSQMSFERDHSADNIPAEEPEQLDRKQTKTREQPQRSILKYSFLVLINRIEIRDPNFQRMILHLVENSM
jgi:hypothetical protein